jgi:hypothetical protein
MPDQQRGLATKTTASRGINTQEERGAYMKAWSKFSIGFLALCIAGALSGCITTKEQRGEVVTAAAKLSGNPYATAAAQAIYSGSRQVAPALPPGWMIGYAPVDAQGKWIAGVAGYMPFIYPESDVAATAFAPAGFAPSGLMSAPANTLPFEQIQHSPIFNPAPVAERRPGLTGAYEAATQAVTAIKE